MIMKNPFNYSIELSKGLGDLHFGCSSKQAEEYLGSPSEIDIVDSTPETSTFSWYYEALKLSLGFLKPFNEPAKDPILILFTTRHPAAELWKQRLIGQTEENVLKIFETGGLTGFIEKRELMGSFEYKNFRLDSPRVSLDFKDGVLRAMLWGKGVTH